jgi:hypothetical protein
MSNSKAILGVCLIFFLGIVTGIALSIRITDFRIRQLTTGGPEILADMVVRRLGRQLELSPVQREKLYTIAKETSVRIAEASSSGEGFVESRPIPPAWLKTEDAVAKIRAILTPEQTLKFNAIVEQDKVKLGAPVFETPRQ